MKKEAATGEKTGEPYRPRTNELNQERLDSHCDVSISVLLRAQPGWSHASATRRRGGPDLELSHTRPHRTQICSNVIWNPFRSIEVCVDEFLMSYTSQLTTNEQPQLVRNLTSVPNRS
jgi:hypothetical protein